MGAFYQVQIYEHTGRTSAPFFRLVATVDPQLFVWAFRYRRALNERGTFTATLDRNSEYATALAARNNLVHVRRKLALSDAWADDATYIVKYARITEPGTGASKLQIGGPSLEWMAECQDVVPADSDADGYSSWAGAADYVMKQFVYRQIGAAANDPYANFPSLQVTGFLPPAEAGLDVSIKGRYGDHVLDVLKKASVEGNQDFWFLLDAGASVIRFNTGRVGADRTVAGNPGGPYVIFSRDRGNMTEIDELEDWRNAITKAYILGAGSGQEQEIEQYPLAGLDIAWGSGRWDRYTTAVNAQRVESGDVVGLRTAGADALDGGKPVRTLDFKAVQLPNSLYGKHYFLGDRVNAESHTGELFTYRISAAEIWLSGQGETIDLEFDQYD